MTCRLEEALQLTMLFLYLRSSMVKFPSTQRWNSGMRSSSWYGQSDKERKGSKYSKYASSSVLSCYLRKYNCSSCLLENESRRDGSVWMDNTCEFLSSTCVSIVESSSSFGGFCCMPNILSLDHQYLYTSAPIS